jgi:hypothetical protein
MQVQLFGDTAHDTRAKIGGLFATLIAANAAAWGWEWAAFSERPWAERRYSLGCSACDTGLLQLY